MRQAIHQTYIPYPTDFPPHTPYDTTTLESTLPSCRTEESSRGARVRIGYLNRGI